jgi:3-oxoacyl-[acyl-carrier protein] reductase
MAGFDGLIVLGYGRGYWIGRRYRCGSRPPGRAVIINYASSQIEAEATADACRKAGAEVRVVSRQCRR